MQKSRPRRPSEAEREDGLHLGLEAHPAPRVLPLRLRLEETPHAVDYAAMHHWLEGFAYRVEPSWTLFAAAGLFGLVVALATVSTQALRAAAPDPVRALRLE